MIFLLKSIKLFSLNFYEIFLGSWPEYRRCVARAGWEDREIWDCERERGEL